MDVTKICSRCKVQHPINSFYVDKARKDGYSPWCKRCHSQNAAKWQKNNPQRNRDIRRKAKWTQRGMTFSIPDYNKMLEAQNECCKICGRHQSLFKTRLHVDHDHKTGRVRGLLCSLCNGHILVVLESYANLIPKALEYLNG